MIKRVMKQTKLSSTNGIAKPLDSFHLRSPVSRKCLGPNLLHPPTPAWLNLPPFTLQIATVPCPVASIKRQALSRPYTVATAQRRRILYQVNSYPQTRAREPTRLLHDREALRHKTKRLCIQVLAGNTNAAFTRRRALAMCNVTAAVHDSMGGIYG